MTELELMERQERKGRLIRQLREKCGYSQQFLSAYLGISRSTLQNVEAGLTGTNDKKFWRFLDLVGVSEAEFAHMLEAGERDVDSEEEHINGELRAVLKFMPLHVKKILHSIFCREWGGDSERLMDIVACHRDLSLMQRLRHSEQYVAEYKLDGEMGILRNDGLEPPDVERLDRVNKEKARAALVSGREEY